MAGIRRTDTSLGWIRRELNEIKRQIRESNAAKRLEAATIGAGGLKIKGDGGIRLISRDGVTQFGLYGEPLLPDPDGNPQPVIVMRREDGTTAMSLDDPFPTLDGYRQILRLFDRAGREIFSEDATSGHGIATPWLSASMYPARYTDWLGTTSGSYENIWQGQFQAMNPCLSLAATWTSDDAATNGDVRFQVNGTTVGASQSVGFGIGANYLVNQEPLPGGAQPGDFITVTLQARRTSGTGKVLCAPYGIQGSQSA